MFMSADVQSVASVNTWLGIRGLKSLGFYIVNLEFFGGVVLPGV